MGLSEGDHFEIGDEDLLTTARHARSAAQKANTNAVRDQMSSTLEPISRSIVGTLLKVENVSFDVLTQVGASQLLSGRA